MEKQVIFRDRQELQSADLNAIGQHASDAIAHLVLDAVSGALKFTGGTVSAKSATEVDVAALRFYNGGKVYASEQTETLNLFQYLPLVAKKCVAVVVWGEVIDTDVQPRDFLVDLTTGATEPQAVAMAKVWKANINLQPGNESVDPQPPVLQTGTLAIALVYLTPGGVERIELQDAARLPTLQGHEQRLFEHEAWRMQAEPRISSIATDLAGLAKKTMSLVGRDTVVELANDVARLKAKVNLPTAYASYESDYYGNADKTDAAGLGYSAAIKNGLLFPTAGQASVGLALFNPYDAGIKRSADDLVLPAYTDRARIQTTGYSGDISASQYQVQSQTIREYTATVWDYTYGWNYNYYNGWWNSWYWNYYGYNWGWYGYYGYRVARQETRYELQTVTTSYNGAIIGQTFLVSNAMWLTKVGLQFTQIGASGDVMVAVCETEGGKPDLLKTLTRVTVARGDLKKYPEETAIPVPPVLLEAGKRYALVLITQGDHRLATVSGNDYTQGTLFFGTDGDYFTGDLTKDLMFTLYAAQFAQPRVEVVLQSVSLAGGISDINIAAPQIVPDGCELRYEIQVGGKWYPLGDAAMRLSTLPDIVPLRLVLLGTSDLAPAFRLAPNAITGSRAATSLAHWSKLRTLAAPSSSITVQVVVAQWDAANHTLACEIKSGATTYTPATTVVRDEPDGQAKRITFTFTPPAISTYAIKLTGARSAASAPFVVVERTDVAT
ncbi:hypothetical protein QF021_000278 [Acidovorax delafieldii]|uniref:hypothetical protein n=1 Tax=Acidovorax delafieldii TaxID=47920 RepID=UPI002863C9CA|nr:hypothetical protein [Acidovorax delafieldii]MDR6152189.1 hypothetical protein [Acidovorax delafieldii]